jgi:putative tricarboxylic transport membrane protein
MAGSGHEAQVRGGPDRASLVVAALGLAVGAVLWVGARNIAPPLFDPVGSAALPKVCAVALAGLGLGTLAQAWLSRRPRPAAEAPPRPGTYGTMALMAGYLLAMQLGLGFLLSTILFTAIAIPLVGGRRRLALLAVPIALALGFGTLWLFTSVFFIDLPGT